MNQKYGEYSESLRVEIVKQVISGHLTSYAARKKYNIRGKSRIDSWVKYYKLYGVCALNLLETKPRTLTVEYMTDKKGKQADCEALQKRIHQLEKQLEEERLLKEMYARMIEMAEQEHKVSIRKKTNTK